MQLEKYNCKTEIIPFTENIKTLFYTKYKTIKCKKGLSNVKIIPPRQMFEEEEKYVFSQLNILDNQFKKQIITTEEYFNAIARFSICKVIYKLNNINDIVNVNDEPFEYYNEYAYLIKVLHFEKCIVAFYRSNYEFILNKYYEEIKEKYDKEIKTEIKNIISI
jgi:hypothetical protein